MAAFYVTTSAQETSNLYFEHIPNTKLNIDLDKNIPELSFYKPSDIKSNKIFLILPGGGYTHLAMGHEGDQVAKRLNDKGYCAFVLKYRLPSNKQQIDRRIASIQDAQQALMSIRKKAVELGISDARVGVLGFSAGGHLASTLSTHYDTDYLNANNDKTALRPDFSILVYPVISMESGVTHNGSRNTLLGMEAKEEDVQRFSNEKNVKSDTPPAFLIHAKDDDAVPIENSLLYQQQLINYHIPNHLYTYEKGGHGFGMYNKLEPNDWFTEMLKWLEAVEI